MHVQLGSLRPFSSGSFRDCYRHPLDQRRCIKIVRQPGVDRHRGSIERLLGRSTPDANERELAEYRRHEARQVPLERYFPRVYGFVETDLGRGLCADLLQGSDEKPPVSITQILGGRSIPGLTSEFILREFETFGRFCADHGILASCDELKNVGFLRDGAGHRLVAFDLKERINKETIPISSFSSFFRRRKIERRFERACRLLQFELRGMARPAPGPVHGSVEPGAVEH